MEYVINQMMIFSPDERALFIINERESFMPLSNPAARLLLELVKNNKEMLTRRHLMQRVWEDKGFVGSNNNLNGCISEVRKAFESLAIDPQIIITIPKLGFILEADISPYSPPILSKKKTESAPPPLRFTTMLKVGKERFYKEKKTLAGATVIISCFGLASAWLQLKEPDDTFKNAHVDYLYKHNQCHVFSLEANELYTRSETISQAAAMLKSEGVDCNDVASDIFYSKIANPNLPFQITFMAICRRLSQGNYGRCQTIKNTDGAAS